MGRLAFLTAVYNEEAEILDLLKSVRPYVDTVVVSDDGSGDSTVELAEMSGMADLVVTGPHLASCEETRIRGFQFITDTWILILDADERIDPAGMQKIRDSLDNLTLCGFTHVYFSQDEVIDSVLVRTFAKIKLARRDSLRLPTAIHDEIACVGPSTNLGVRVLHRKTSAKQVMREAEYLEAYERKIDEGKMTRQRVDEVTGWHHFVRERNGSAG